MLDHEYETMRRVEDTYWWYRVLRALTAAAVARHFRTDAEACVLDAGCGTGGTLETLRHTSATWRLHGFDYSPLAVAHSKERGFPDVKSGSVNAMPEHDAAYDAVVSLDVLCCGGVEVDSAFGEFRRVLKPGGILVLNLPAFPALQGRHDIAVNSARRFTAENLHRLLVTHGFELVTLHYWNAWLFLPILAWRQITRIAARQHDQGTVESDLFPLPSCVNAALTCIGWTEARLCKLVRPPFGTSVFSVARKQIPP